MLRAERGFDERGAWGAPGDQRDAEVRERILRRRVESRGLHVLRWALR